MNSDDFRAPSVQEFEALENRILTQIGQRERGRRRRRQVVVAGAAALALVGGASISAVTLAGQAQRTRTAYCYAAADTSSRFTQVGAPDSARDPSGQWMPVGSAPADRLGAAAVENCAAVWRIGFFDSETSPADDGVESAVPELQDCLRSDRVPAVLPRADGDTRSPVEFCKAVGLLGPAEPGIR